jgi:hypothetical protein
MTVYHKFCNQLLLLHFRLKEYLLTLYWALLCPTPRTTDLGISLFGGPGTQAHVKEALSTMSIFINAAKCAASNM